MTLNLLIMKNKEIMATENNVILEDVLLVTYLETVCWIKNLTVAKSY